MLQAFGIRQVSNRRLPYDYGSLMHYHAVAHAVKVSDFTIVPKELKYVTTMGTEKMAFLDAKVINDIYCPSKFIDKHKSIKLIILKISVMAFKDYNANQVDILILITVKFVVVLKD